MTNEKYNGWTNYATWRVNLEVFDGFDIDQDDAYELSKYLKEYLSDYLIETTSEGIARDYALAFVSDVNYYEIAEHLIEANEA